MGFVLFRDNGSELLQDILEAFGLRVGLCAVFHQGDCVFDGTLVCLHGEETEELIAEHCETCCEEKISVAS